MYASVISSLELYGEALTQVQDADDNATKSKKRRREGDKPFVSGCYFLLFTCKLLCSEKLLYGFRGSNFL